VRLASAYCVLAIAAWTVFGPARVFSADAKEAAVKKLGRQELIQARALALDFMLRLQDLDNDSPDYGSFWYCYYPDGKLPASIKPRRGITHFDQPYMENAGFVLEAFAEASALPDGKRYLDASAVCIEDWFIKRLQFDKDHHPKAAGALAHNVGHPIVLTFDNGEAARGTLYIYRKTGNPEYLKLVEQIAHWAINTCLKPDGSMLTAIDLSSGAGGYRDPDGMVYQARGWGWTLAELWKETGKEEYRLAAERILRWTVAQQRPNGWLAPCHEYAFYGVEGLYFGGKLLGNKETVAAAGKFLDASIKLPRHPQWDFLYLSYTPDWVPSATGDQQGMWNVDGQQARLCYNFYKDTKDRRYLAEGDRILRELLGIQVRESKDPMMIGGLPKSCGTSPWHTRLSTCSLKYFIDVVTLRLNIGDIPLE
jgi:hypothetical protein